MIYWLLVATGGAIGALLRYGVGRGVEALGVAFPWGTLTVNLLGSFLIGVVMYGSQEQGWFDDKTRLFLTVGILGAFTTMSTFSYESIKMMEDKQHLLFIGYVLGTVVLALLGVYLGRGLVLMGARP
ncbi:MAG: fluoride efflux transporter CrcB [Thermoplasmata archaeon]|nr:fluoride efflux transporter CrcB [Thermoplasmata archaeon]